MLNPVAAEEKYHQPLEGVINDPVPEADCKNITDRAPMSNIPYEPVAPFETEDSFALFRKNNYKVRILVGPNATVMTPVS